MVKRHSKKTNLNVHDKKDFERVLKEETTREEKRAKVFVTVIFSILILMIVTILITLI